MPRSVMCLQNEPSRRASRRPPNHQNDKGEETRRIEIQQRVGIPHEPLGTEEILYIEDGKGVSKLEQRKK